MEVTDHVQHFTFPPVQHTFFLQSTVLLYIIYTHHEQEREAQGADDEPGGGRRCRGDGVHDLPSIGHHQDAVAAAALRRRM